MANNTWKNYTQKSTALSDNDEVMLLDSTDEKNKRGLMSKFWNYVVDKMSTAVISKLETNNKTIIGAINALNSDKLRIINNGSVQPNSIIFVSFQDQTINSKFFVVPINTNIAEGHINISLINSQNRVFIGVFSYEINNGTLTANKGLVYNAYDHSTTEYNAPVIAEIMCINK